MKIKNETVRSMMTDYYYNMITVNRTTTLSKEEVKRVVESVTRDVNWEQFNFDDCFNVNDVLTQIFEDYRYLIFSGLKEVIYQHINEILGRNNISPIYPLLD
ncbi:hypothetical protein GMB50_11710 [Turicibacter sanguinis]|uniref:hypothetical protein n=1 Tax=Turicibacter sanguinis TaxID=154288 RepID=UPI0012BD6234|nr:hypothetical protein [Turicibacter sanguinis]MDB8566257.1 hypothetical protein [Turicibacter sanguinis]MDB8568879.1 hypothetical protein [Turicibacter sanguinis]MDB8571758.1 hypothetical protein [Turicibacter sanguinis]MDB8580387.1 hypothetical protein [Turicibacter sanguinis]MTO10652.1 hypothetical protein [Turicibacter sanguinis]